jgi:hypothetical protein
MPRTAALLLAALVLAGRSVPRPREAFTSATVTPSPGVRFVRRTLFRR